MGHWEEMCLCPICGHNPRDTTPVGKPLGFIVKSSYVGEGLLVEITCFSCGTVYEMFPNKVSGNFESRKKMEEEE